MCTALSPQSQEEVAVNCMVALLLELGADLRGAVLPNSAKYCECLSESPMTTLAGALDFTIAARVCTHFRFAELEHPLQPLCTH